MQCIITNKLFPVGQTALRTQVLKIITRQTRKIGPMYSHIWHCIGPMYSQSCQRWDNFSGLSGILVELYFVYNSTNIPD